MIHFDTNALIALPLWAHDGHPAIARIANGEPCAACAVVWYEFLIGPIEAEEIQLAHAFIQGAVIPLETADASLAATLFNAAGRRRTLKTDALIAAAAIRADAELLTLNVDDFEPFESQGLRLVPLAGG